MPSTAMKTFFVALALVIAAVVASPAANSNDTSDTALYHNNCDGSGFCSSAIIGNCRNAIGNVNAGATYSDQARFSVGHCYMIYATNNAGPQPISGQIIIDAANTILANCNGCGSYGTNDAGCPSCHVTLNYRS
ncbi:hypothetical protein EVG20_g6728 [Dentipellis fragilis]|uniref:Uncharacterized protein n=1 Tax=Dentipellis fragilis TaxID=205917 RepID=A0A4Y9YK91_9AGAM|nr:hypothetical protein EVG20_g6728 [Dentipellis fragilis]